MHQKKETNNSQQTNFNNYNVLHVQHNIQQKGVIALMFLATGLDLCTKELLIRFAHLPEHMWTQWNLKGSLVARFASLYIFFRFSRRGSDNNEAFCRSFPMPVKSITCLRGCSP